MTRAPAGERPWRTSYAIVVSALAVLYFVLYMLFVGSQVPRHTCPIPPAPCAAPVVVPATLGSLIERSQFYGVMFAASSMAAWLYLFWRRRVTPRDAPDAVVIVLGVGAVLLIAILYMTHDWSYAPVAAP